MAGNLQPRLTKAKLLTQVQRPQSDQRKPMAHYNTQTARMHTLWWRLETLMGHEAVCRTMCNRQSMHSRVSAV